MPTACLFGIGTGHHSDEDINIMVKLWKACRKIGMRDLGTVGNQVWNDFSGYGDWGQGTLDRNIEKKGDYLKNQPAAGNASGWTWINEGQNLWGFGISEQTNKNVDIIGRLNKSHGLDKVIFVGHSRGAIQGVRIAGKTYQTNSNIKFALFLIDPVKGEADPSPLSGQIYPNVEHLKIILAEDEDSKGFNQANLWGMRGKAIGAKDYLRLPGTHGTATAATEGNPIGQIAWYNALKFMQQYGVSLPGSLSADLSLLHYYGWIHVVNPVVKRKRKVLDYGHGKKDKRGQYKYEVKQKKIGGDRSKGLDRRSPNPHMGSAFFINLQHYELFKAEWPDFAEYIKELSDGKQTIANSPCSLQMQNHKRRFTRTHQVLKRILSIPG
jgi:hypothetical protein